MFYVFVGWLVFRLLCCRFTVFAVMFLWLLMRLLVFGVLGFDFVGFGVWVSCCLFLLRGSAV